MFQTGTSKLAPYTMRRFIYPVAVPFLRLYWRWAKPKTFGVKVIIQYPESNQVLLVQHTYCDTSIWHLPGGGFNPKQESAEEATCREVFEELGIGLAELTYLTEYKTSAEGKRDTVSIFTAVAKSDELTLSSEIRSAEWFDLSNIPVRYVYSITKFALENLAKKKGVM